MCSETVDVDAIREDLPKETVRCYGCDSEINLLDIRVEQEAARIHRETQRHVFIDADDCPDSHGPEMPLSLEIYDTPWQDSGTVRYFCDRECERATMESGSLYQPEYCEECGRTICASNPSNGRMRQLKYMTGGQFGYGCLICLRCYQEYVLSGGLKKDDFEDSIPGMFFNRGNPEPKARGYVPVPGWEDVKVHTSEPFNNVARELIGRGYDVVPGYERLSIIGDQGYVTMLARRPEGSDLPPVESLHIDQYGNVA